MKLLFRASLALNTIGLFILMYLAYHYREYLYVKRIELTQKANLSFIGDSHTEVGKWNTWLKRTDVIGIGRGGFTTEQITLLIPEIIRYHPKYCFVLAGVNDIGKKCFTVTSTLEAYKQIADSLHAHQITPIFQSVFYKSDDAKFNAVVDSIDSGLKKFCAEQKIDFIDLRPVLCTNNFLRKELARQDGVHLNQKGQEIWASALVQYINSRNF